LTGYRVYQAVATRVSPVHSLAGRLSRSREVGG
jgi:hypothetical protein